MQFHITYQPHLDRPAETIEAERADRELSGPHLVFRAFVPVINDPREIVVRSCSPLTS